jgi:hypothetical protein
MGFFSKDSREAVFWKWFLGNQGRLEHFEDDKEALIEELGTALRSYAEGLVFEISAGQNGIREFVISADGIERLFPHVTRLAAAAPALPPTWKITAFRPRMDDYTRFSLTYGGREFDPKEIWFHSQIEDGNFDVIFYHPSYRDEDRDLIVSGTYILLDMALGEYDVVTGIHHLDHQLLPADPTAEGLRPLAEFRTAFDDFKTQK